MVKQKIQVNKRVDPEVFIVSEGTEEDSEVGYANRPTIKSFLSLPVNTVFALNNKEDLDNKETSELKDTDLMYPSLSLLKKSLSNKEDKDETILKEADVVNDLSSTSTSLPLSAKSGSDLKGLVEGAKPKFREVTSSRNLNDDDRGNILAVESTADITLNVIYQNLTNIDNFGFSVIRNGSGKVFVNFDRAIRIKGQSGSTIELHHRYDVINFKFDSESGDWFGWGNTLQSTSGLISVRGVNFSTNTEEQVEVETIHFDSNSGLYLEDGEDENEVSVKLGSHFKTIEIEGGEDIVASGEDTLSIASGEGIKLQSTPDTNTFTIGLDGGGLKSSSIFVTNVQPANNRETVNLSTMRDHINIVDSFQTTTNNIVLTIEFDGGSNYRGDYTANGVPFDNYQRLSGRYFRATVALSISSNESEIDIVGNNGRTKVSYSFLSTLTVDAFDFNTSSYPSGQTELKAGEEVEIFVKGSEAVDTIYTVDSEALLDRRFVVNPKKSHTIKVPVKGQPKGSYNGKVKIRSANTGAISNIKVSSNKVDLNNNYPSVSLVSIDYPDGQQALKDNESALLVIDTQGEDSINISSSDFNTFLNGSEITAFLQDSGHSKDNSEINIAVTKSSNQATSSISPSVAIAHEPTEWQPAPFKQIRTSPNTTEKTINLSFNEDLLNVSLSNIEEVTFNSLRENNASQWKLDIGVSDSNNHSNQRYTFDVLVSNLALRETTLTGEFKIKGFFPRLYTVNTQNTLQLDLGITVINSQDLVVTSESPPFTYTLVSEFSSDGSEIEFKYLGNNTIEFSEDLTSFLTGNDPPGTLRVEVEEL